MTEGLSETFARLQKEDGLSHAGVALHLFKDIFFGTRAEESPKKQLRVFAAGLPRSGTGSLAVALTELGYRPLHGPGITELAPVLSEHYEGKASLSDLIAYAENLGYDAQGLDQMGWKLYKEAARIPSLKIVLTLHPRGAFAWAESWSSFAPDHIHSFSKPPFSLLPSLRQVMALQRDFLRYLDEWSVDANLYDGTESIDPMDPLFAYPAPNLATAYRLHSRNVQKTVPKDRLLVFDPTQGWEPLCEFLEVDDCPTTPYPHMTDRQLMMVISKVAWAITMAWPVLGLMIPVGLLRWRRRRRAQWDSAMDKRD